MATQTDKLTVAQKAAQTRVPSVRGISQPDAAKLVSEAVEDFDRAHRREEPAERSDTQRT